MANSLNTPLQGKVILLSRSVMPVSFRSLPLRAVYVKGGEGTEPHTSGERLVVQYFSDGSNMSVNARHDIDGIIAESKEDFDYEQWCEAMGKQAPSRSVSI
jgi:hypothetical protein